MSMDTSHDVGSIGPGTERHNNDAACGACGAALTLSSQHGYPNWAALSYSCPDCGLGEAVEVTATGDLGERTKRYLDSLRSSTATCVSALRLAAFVTGDIVTGTLWIERVDEYTYVVDLPERASPWELLQFADQVAVGPLETSRQGGRVVVRDTRWTSTDDWVEVRADGGSTQVRTVDDVADATDPFAVSEDTEPRTKRAKTENMDVSFLAKPGRYEVHSASDSYYEVDVLEETCTCPDRAERCKHLRRVDLEIRAGLVPRPDGRLP
jgi:hypothetical protein